MSSDHHPSLDLELDAGLHALEERRQRRSLVEIHGVNLCSNDYLGLAGNPALREAVLAAVSGSLPIGGTGSRLLSGHFGVWDDLEAEFAEFAGTEAALFFGSGYAANLGLLSSLLQKDSLVFSDALNHASLIDGIRLSGARRVIYPHRDLNALETELRKHAAENCRKFIVTESVFSMDGDIADIPALALLADCYGASLIVDEAHATAVHGSQGRGIVAACGAVSRVAAVVHTCGKALASAGAFVCGSAVLKEHLINHARTFIFSTALPPYMAAQVRAALRLAQGMDAQRDALLSNSRRLAGSLARYGWDTSGTASQIVPVIVGDNDAALTVADHLQRDAFAVRAIRPPTVPQGRSRLRFSLTAAVSAEELVRLENSLRTWQQVAHTAAGHS